jgi:hypothetical protein
VSVVRIEPFRDEGEEERIFLGYGERVEPGGFQMNTAFAYRCPVRRRGWS